jgi:hypothetical protein
MNRHGKMNAAYKNAHENTNDHRPHIAGILRSLASHCHTAVHCHHHRQRITLFRPQVSHRIERHPHQMGQPHSHRTHDHPLELFGKWNRLRIRFRDRPAEPQLYTPRVDSRSLPLSLPHPSHHVRRHYCNRYGHIPLPALELVVRISSLVIRERRFTRSVSRFLRSCENPGPSCRLRRSTLCAHHETSRRCP